MSEQLGEGVQVGDTVDKKYRVLRRLGAGGGGVVFEAENLLLTRRVALKVLLSSPVIDADVVERFKLEARAPVRVPHPNIIDVLDMGRDARTGAFFIVEELLTGESLRDALDARGPLPVHEALRAICPVMEALDAVHQRGIVHRDVKPENVFLARDARGGVTPKLLDFGVSKAPAPREGARVTLPGAVIGSLGYMAPEQALGSVDVDARADVWAVGAVLFEALSGQLPFPPTSQYLHLAAYGTPPPLASLAPGLPPGLCAAVDRALRRDRAERFEGMAAFLEALRALRLPGAGPRRPAEPTAVPADLRPAPSPSSPSAGRPQPARVLVADDDAGVRRLIRRVVGDHDVVEVEDGAAAVDRIAHGGFDLVLTDLQMPRANGVEVVRAAVRAGAPVIMITGTGTTETAVQVMRLGAVNYITKPFEPDALGRVIADVLAARDLLLARRDEVVGSDPGFRAVLEQVEAVADTPATVLITGETGTGKEVIARLMHRLSARRAGSFVCARVGSGSTEAAERELFGWARGALPGADADHGGLVGDAQGGTLFFDDVGSLSRDAQAKVLRLVEDRAWTPQGAPRPRRADVRVLASAGVDLEAKVRRGEFRADLYYRLGVVEIRVPPLRERPGDVRALAARFVETANRENRRRVEGVDESALALLCDHPWPGNVRELHNVITRAVILKQSGAITAADLPRELRERSRTAPLSGWPSAPPPAGDDALRARSLFEADVVLQALARAAGPGDAILELLGLDRATLAQRLRPTPT
ncbi:MAG: sigma 54-interacting transcriptional regulator [Polyangiales bacterium]